VENFLSLWIITDNIANLIQLESWFLPIPDILELSAFVIGLKCPWLNFARYVYLLFELLTVIISETCFPLLDFFCLLVGPESAGALTTLNRHT
jgi:hypothetical protein